MAELNKDTQARIAAEEKMTQLNASLSDILMKNLDGRTREGKILKENTKSILKAKDLESKLSEIAKAKDKVIKEIWGTNRELAKSMLEQLETTEKLTKTEKEIKDLSEELKNNHKEIKDNLYDSLGTLGKMLKAGTALSAAMALFNGLTKQIGDGLKNTLGYAAQLRYEIGLSSDAASQVVTQTTAAGLSIDGLRFSQQELNAAASTYIDTFGTAKGLTSDLITNVADLTKLTGDSASAIKLNQLFESTGQEASILTDKIKSISEKEGVAASKVIQGMAGNMDRLVGASEETLTLFAKQNAELLKSGLSMDKLQSISENMLDIEGSMKAQAKARIMLQGELTQEQMNATNAIRQQSLAFADGQLNADEFREAIQSSLISSEKFGSIGYKRQQAYAASIGMTVGELTQMYQTIEANNKVQEEANLAQKAFGKASEVWASTPDLIKNATTGLIAFIGQMAIMNMMQGKGTGLGNLNPFKKKGGGGGDVAADVANTNEGGGDVGNASQGAGGGLKSLAEGLKAMGDGKVFAGIGAVALAGPAFIIALPAIPFLLFMGKVKLKALKENFTGLAEGLSQMSTTFMGSLALGTFAIAAIPSILGIPFLTFMGKVKLKSLEENFGSLGRGLAQMPQGALGALTMLIAGPALALGMLAIPFLAFMSIPAIGPVIQANFTALAAGLAAFGNPATALFVLIGIGLMAALGAAMIPFAYALSLLSPLVEAFGNVIVGVMSAVPPIIEAIANGFVTMMSAITPEAILGLTMLGPALLLASVGMVAFSAAMLVGGLSSFFGGGIIDDIKELAMTGPMLQMAGEGMSSVTESFNGLASTLDTVSASLEVMGGVSSQLYVVAGGLYSIAGGLVSVAGAGLLATPAIGGLIALASVAPVLQSLGEFFGFGGESESSSDTSTSSQNNKELIDEIKGLRSDIQSQPIMITVDGKVVSEISKVQNKQTLTKGVYRK